MQTSTHTQFVFFALSWGGINAANFTNACRILATLVCCRQLGTLNSLQWSLVPSAVPSSPPPPSPTPSYHLIFKRRRRRAQREGVCVVGDKVAVADTRRRQAPLIETSRSLQNKQREPESDRKRGMAGETEEEEQREENGSGSGAPRSLLFVRTAERRSRPFAFRQVV